MFRGEREEGGGRLLDRLGKRVHTLELCSRKLVAWTSADSVHFHHHLSLFFLVPSLEEAQCAPSPSLTPYQEALFCIFRTVDSALNGLKLVLRHQYVALLFGISCLYEVVLTILDYQMKVRTGDSPVQLHVPFAVNERSVRICLPSIFGGGRGLLVVS